jgi:hypothetical protein
LREFWKNIIQASDRGLIPHRYTVEALGYNYEGTLAEREREIARGDDESLVPGSVPYSSPEAGPQDTNEGRPSGGSRNNGRPGGPESEDPTRHPGRRVVRKTAGETIKAIVDKGAVAFIGETTRALLAEYEDRMDLGYVTAAERESIDVNQVVRSASSVIVPVNPDMACIEFRTAKLDEGLRVVIGQRRADGALVAKALRFSEPHYNLLTASEFAIKWGFLSEPLIEVAGKKRCKNCGNELPSYSSMNPVCPHCNYDNTPAMGAEGGPISGGSAETGVLAKLIEGQQGRDHEIVQLLREVVSTNTAIREATMSTHHRMPGIQEQAAALQRVIYSRENDEYAKFHSAEKRRQLAKEDKALPDGSYPIEDAGDLGPAISLAQSGHGNVDAAKALIKRRAKALGKSDMIPEDWASVDEATMHLPPQAVKAMEEILTMIVRADEQVDRAQPALAALLGRPNPDPE